MLHTKNIEKEVLEKAMADNKIMFINYRRVYQLMWSSNFGGFYFIEIPHLMKNKRELPYTKRGRYHAITPEYLKQLQNIK